MWRFCQCGKFASIISDCDWEYRAGLNEIIEEGVGTRKGAHYTDLNININNQFYKINLLSMQAGEIKKSTQPCTRKKRLGTGTFHDDAFILQLGARNGVKGIDAGPYYIEWRLKKRFTKNQIKIKKSERSKDVANFWYQNWSVHGLREEKHVDLNTKQFVAIHNNKFVHGTSREECENRIVLYVYVGDGAPDIEVMEINGKKLKSKDECERIRENLEEKKRRKLERKEIRKREKMCRKRRRDEMESEWIRGSENMPIKIEDDLGTYTDSEIENDYGDEGTENSNSLMQPPLKKHKNNPDNHEINKWKKLFEETKQQNDIMQLVINSQNEIIANLEVDNKKLQKEIFKMVNHVNFEFNKIVALKSETVNNFNTKSEEINNLDFSGLKDIKFVALNDDNLNQLSNGLEVFSNGIDPKINVIGSQVFKNQFLNDFRSTLPALEMCDEDSK